jgi:3-hydroxyisobutyrate dehydrogenase-like beta-hydroxyacid dehydrogenase
MNAAQSRETAAWAGSHGVTYLEGSILGFPSDISSGTARIVYAGPRDAFDRNESLLTVLGGDPQHISGEIGAAVTFDRIIFAFSYGVMHSFMQGAAMAHAKGISVGAFADTAIARLPAYKWKLELFRDMIAKRNYDDVQASLNLHAAAFAECLAICREACVDDGLPAAIMRNFERAIAAGHGAREQAAVFEVLIQPER